MKIDLTECEIAMAMAVAQWRQLRVWREQLGKGHGELSSTDLARHMLGAIGELAVAKALGRFWGGSAQDFGKEGDVGNLEVRATTLARGSLIVYEQDPPSRVLVLVVIGPGWARIAGWCRAQDAPDVGLMPPAKAVRPGSPRQWWIAQERLNPFMPHRRQEVEA